MDWNLEKENLERLILTDKVSYEEIGRMYGCTGSNIRRVAKRLNISIVKRRSINANETFNKGKKLVTRVCLNCGKELSNHNSTTKYCNNSEDNLQLLCPNCHSLTENYGRLNAKSTRPKK